MEVVVLQLIIMLLFFLGAVMATVIPVLISHRQKYQPMSNTKCHTIINACNSIGGGVLLATCFIALVPLVERSYREALEAVGKLHSKYPYAEITILCGLFLVVFIEQLVVAVQSKQKADKQSSPDEELEKLFSDDDVDKSIGSERSERSSGQPTDSDGHDHGHGHSHAHNIASKSLLHSVILVITLGLHTLFEGMAIGLVDDINILITLVIAVMLHELCCAIALGVNLGQQKISRKTAIIVCIVFSIMMPSGIALGMALGSIKGFTGLVLTAILQGIATGTFVYVLFIEVIPSSMSSGNSIVHLVLMLLGCAVMTIIIVFTHSHVHEHKQYNCTLNAT